MKYILKMKNYREVLLGFFEKNIDIIMKNEEQLTLMHKIHKNISKSNFLFKY